MTTAPESAPELVLLRSLTHLMARWSSSATQASVAQAADVALDTADIPPVYMLGLGGPMRAAELATSLHVSRPTMSKQLARLESAGLIVREPDPADGRAAIVRLSPAGATAHERLVAEGHRMIRRALRGWSPATASDFAAQLQVFTDALGADDSANEPAADAVRSGPER